MAHVVGISLEHEMSLLAAFLLINAFEDIFSKQFRRVGIMIIENRVHEGLAQNLVRGNVITEFELMKYFLNNILTVLLYDS